MKYFTSIISLLLCLPSFQMIQADYGLNLQPVGLEGLKKSVLPSLPSHIDIFIGEDSMQKKKLLENLRPDYKNFLDKEKQWTDSLEKQIEFVKKDIEQTKSVLLYSHGSYLEFLQKKLNVLDKKFHLLPDIKDLRHQIADIMKQHIEFLEKYFQSIVDPLHSDAKSLYTFSDVQKLTHTITLAKETLSRLQNKKENEELLISRMESVSQIKEKEIKSLTESVEMLKKSQGDSKNQLILFDLEKEALQQEKELAGLKIDAADKTIEFIESQIFVENYKINQLESQLTMMRSRMHIDMHDVLQSEQDHDNLKKEAQAAKIELMKKRTDLTVQKTYLQTELEQLANKYKISLANIRQIDDWELSSNSINEAFATYSVEFAHLAIVITDQKTEEIRLALLLLDSKLMHAQVLQDVVKSFYAMSQAKFSDSDQLEKERLHYKDLKSSIQNTLKLYQDQTIEIHTTIKTLYKKIHAVKKELDKFKSSYSQEEIIANQRKYNEGIALLQKSIKSVEGQNEGALKLSEQYAILIEHTEETLVLINFMLQELDLIGVWHRSNRAVTFEGIKQIIPNLITFARNVYIVFRDYCRNLHPLKTIYNFILHSTPLLFFYILLGIFFYIIFLSIQAILPALFKGLMFVNPEMQGLFLLSRIFAVLCGFLQKSLGLISLWLILFMTISLGHFSIAMTLIFYAMSIVFLIYLSRVFLRYLITFNKSIDFILLGKSFENRFVWIFSFFSTSTIVILFFRKMFMLVMLYQHSEFPIILLRLYHVVIFISVVFSIEKEELLNLIPKTNAYFTNLSEVINQYYYLLSLFCILVLILSDPYLGGYGQLMWHIIFNGTLSILLVTSIYLIYNAVKIISSWIFFKDRGELGLKERFEYGKISYAISMLGLFLLFFIVTFLSLAHIWGYTIVYSQFDKFLHYPVFAYTAGTKVEFLRVAGFIRLAFSVVLAFLVAFLCQKFILQRIFDVQYVDPGVQDTIMTISRYCIIVTTILIGFAREGLGSYVLYALAIGLVTFGWTFKDLFADVVAYFFILVQQPIKVGDFVKLDDHILGVVKKISPRAVILRRKNAVTIVVPNSIILKTALYNWNYTRGYIAFDDIIFSVPFSCDPNFVKDLLFKTVNLHADILKVPEPIIRLDEFSDKGYTFMVRAFISSGNTLNQWVIASDVRLLIVQALQEHGIKVAEPVLNIKMKQ